jgi:3-hydroxy-9,10-secoandrosta-1,3,5(10)-triene-9,17-dione monooxygenase
MSTPRRCRDPARWGGGEFDYALMIEVAAELGRACGSTGWVHINLASHYWMIGMWPDEAQAEVWGDDPAAMAASSLIYPAGRAKTVKGGYELSGRWPFCSGIRHSDWIILGGMVAGGSGAPPKPHMFLVPTSSLKQIDTWDVLGLRGTASIDVEGEDIFVPAHMALDADALRGGPTPGSEVNPSALYMLPVWALLPHVIGAPIVGMAKGIYDTCVEATATRISTFNASKVADHATTQLRIADAGAAADAALALIVANCWEATRIAEADGIPDTETKYRWRRDGAYAANLAGDGALQLFRNAGGGGIYDKNPLQRRFRDLNAGLGHIGVSTAVNGVGHGRVALGLEPDNPLV